MNWKRIVPWVIGFVLVMLLLLALTIQRSPPTSAPTKATTRILFIGNSLTFFSDMPEMVAELARSAGHEVDIDMSAQGGWTLSDHAASETTLHKIEQDWDYVILQEQSVIPSIENERNQHMYPAVRLLHDKAKERGATLILFVTWGHRDGFPDAGFKDFDDMQAQLYASYMNIANELDVMVAPVGTAWQNGIAQNPQLSLWHIDGVHPSKEGSYLCACVFYAVIFQQSPEGLTYKAELSEEMAQFLQAIAAETVLENPGHWNIL